MSCVSAARYFAQHPPKRLHTLEVAIRDETSGGDVAHYDARSARPPGLTRDTQPERGRPPLRNLQVVAFVALDVGEVINPHVPLGASTHGVVQPHEGPGERGIRHPVAA